MKKTKDQQQTAVGGWEEEGGAVPSQGAQKAESDRQAGAERSATRAAFDNTHESSARGEHRYSDSHQTEAEQKARHDRDDLKRKLGGTR